MADDPIQKLDEVYWLNVLGPALVEGLGRAGSSPRPRRAWLPFLRARHHLQSQQSAFDHSLTQLYRAAARHTTPAC